MSEIEKWKLEQRARDVHIAIKRGNINVQKTEKFFTDF